ncbi:hypothetical protein OPV22_022051 [Ensete ventricosum]|uniref:Protein LNK1 n=1 Tax=Ensete ventricosum TaxID=4639 RepID=A0AAV8QEP6_ENSVE|nr:hypothetical protein OPV22_022051 [Ensete ventricosum]
MADWNEREIEDIVFGKFGKNDDHRVAHRHGRSVKEPLASDDILVTGTSEDSKVSKTKGNWRKEGTNICPSSEIGNSRIVAGLDNNTCSTSYPIGASRGTAEEMDICQVSFDNNTTADSKLTFLENDNDRENDLLYYDWSDISNFEDVDTMFRNCDPTFGQWSNTDGRSWISSSSNDIFDPEDTFISGFESSTLEFRDFNDASAYCANISSLPESNTPEVSNHSPSCLAHQSFELLRGTEQPYDGGGGSETKSAQTEFGNVNSLNECEFQQSHINIQTEQLSRQYPSEAEGKCFEPYQSQILRKHNCFMKSDHSSYMPALKLDAHIEDKLLYRDLLMPTTSNSINECKQNPSSSFEISAQAISNTSHGVENLPDFISEDPVMHLKEMVEIPSIGPLELVNSVKEQPDDLGRDRGNMGLELHATEMNFTVGTSSSVPSVFSEDASVKAISFQQLQDVIGQLDLRTKLCIRDSLYRLARSAEQRHSFAAANNENVECRRGVHGTANLRKSAVYMDMETETNPIDRTVAHLLFHRQTESANRFADDAISLESHMA